MTPHPSHTGRMPTSPCNGLTPLFLGTDAEIRDGVVHSPTGYQTAINVCGTCPMRQPCAAQGVRHKDRYTVRAGLRLWVHSERAQLLAIAEGDQP